MPEAWRKFDRDFRAGAVRIVAETGKPIAVVARDLGIHPGTLDNWVSAERRSASAGALDVDERAELARLRHRWAELEMERNVLNNPWSFGRTRRQGEPGSLRCFPEGRARDPPRSVSEGWQ